MSGISLDKNGNLKFNINAGAQIIVESSPGNWEDARNFYVTLSAKAKLAINNTNPANRTFVITPKGVELSLFKIYKGDEEMFLEQMLTQSLLNVQIDQFRKTLKPVAIPLMKFENPKEFQCLGFNLTDLDVKIDKGYIQLSAGYEKIDITDKEVCEAFEKALQEGPMKAMKKMSEEFSGGFSSFSGMGMGGDSDKKELPHKVDSLKTEDNKQPKKEEGSFHTDEF